MPESTTDQLTILNRIYPEIGAGGYSRVDGTIEFYTRVNSLLDQSMVVVDYGAGRGEWMRDPVQYRRNLRDLRGKVRRVVAVDVDDAVTTNESVDERIVAPDPKTIPLRDESIDLIVCDHTFEHLDDPAELSLEMYRILRPGGWICARTPNRLGYIAAATSLIPNDRHARTLRTLQPQRESIDVFPTRYRVNTMRTIRRYFPTSRFDDFSYVWAGEPSYFGRSIVLAKIIRTGCRVLPEALQPKLFIFLRKVER